MDAHAEQERAKETASQEEQPGILQEIQQREQRGPWHQQILTFLAWSGGFAGAMGLIMVVLLLIVELLSSEQQFTARALSDWFFWGAALLLLGGLLAPSASEMQESSRSKSSSRKRGSAARRASTQRASPTRRTPIRRSSNTQRATEEETPKPSFQSRREKAIRRRLLRVYNPWRWRLWASALICFGFSMLAGLWA